MTETLQAQINRPDERVETEVPPPAYMVAEGVLESATKEYDQAVINAELATDALDPAVAAQLDRLSDSYAGQVANGEAAENMSSDDLEQIIRQVPGVPESFVQAMMATRAAEDSFSQAQRALEAHIPDKMAAVHARLAEIEMSLDYDAFVALPRAVAYDSWRQLGFINHARRLLASSPTIWYGQLQTIEDKAEAAAADWTESGLLRPAGSEADNVPDDVQEQPLSQVVAEGQQQAIVDAYELHIRYKVLDPSIKAQVHETLAVIDEFVESLEPSPEPKVETIHMSHSDFTNTQLQAALGRKVTKTLAALPPRTFETNTDSDAYQQLVEEDRSIDVEAALADMEVSGDLAGLPFAFDEAELKDYLQTSLPPLAIKQVKRIEIRPMTKEENPRGNKLGHCLYVRDLSGVVIVINSENVYARSDFLQTVADEDFAGLPTSGAVGENAKRAMLETVVHELGHGLHFALPAAALKRWDEAIADDPVRSITAYAKSKQEGKQTNATKDEFAESIAMFVTKPALLRLISRGRYAAMKQLYKEYMPEYEQTLQKQQDLNIFNHMLLVALGVDEEKVKSLYLKLENLEENTTEVQTV